MKIKFDYDSGRHKAVLASEDLPSIREHFSVEDKNQIFKRRFTPGYRMPTRVYAITPQGRFDLRLVNEILRFLKDKYFNVEVEYTNAFKNASKVPSLDKSQIFFLPVTLEKQLRDYQVECIELALQCGSGVIVLPTSAGKTLVMGTLITSVQMQLAENFKTLVIVPDIGLVTQTYKDFVEYGIPLSKLTMWTGTFEPDKNASIIITNSQILLSKKQDLSLLKEIQLLLIDEVHKLKSTNKISKIVAKIPAKLRYGLTGTLPDDKMDRWYIVGQLGDVLYTKKSIELRQQKYITDVLVVALKIEYLNPPYIEASNSANPTAAYEQELEFLQTNIFRNSLIKDVVSKLNKNCLILVDRIAHGDILLQVLTTLTDKFVCFISGDVEQEERERVKTLMEEKDNVVCIAISKIFSTGVNIRNLHYVFFASIGKAKNKIIQSIGRSLRLHASKKQAVIFDIGDGMRYGSKHLAERLALYDSESIKYTIKNIKENI
jgi:superfamily II DNA or RNA helicase